MYNHNIWEANYIRFRVRHCWLNLNNYWALHWSFARPRFFLPRVPTCLACSEFAYLHILFGFVFLGYFAFIFCTICTVFKWFALVSSPVWVLHSWCGHSVLLFFVRKERCTSLRCKTLSSGSLERRALRLIQMPTPSFVWSVITLVGVFSGSILFERSCPKYGILEIFTPCMT